MTVDEERIAMYLDYENLAIGARENLNGMQFDLLPIVHALADRGRVVVRRAYADWSYFDEDRRMLTRHHVELIEIPQKMGAVRKNAADIKLAVDALELSFEREYVTTFVICTGDSDFTPLVDKLRSLNKRVIGVGVEGSTSRLLPPACDEFLFYDRLEGVEIPSAKPTRSRGSRPTKPTKADDTEEIVRTDVSHVDDLIPIFRQTLTGLQHSGDGVVHASALKRALLRKDPAFSEVDYGFRAFGELLRHLEERHVIEQRESGSAGDPAIDFPDSEREEGAAFELLQTVVRSGISHASPHVALSGLKTKVRKRDPDFSEKKFGYGGFLQFCKAARARGYVEMSWDSDLDDYALNVPDRQGG